MWLNPNTYSKFSSQWPVVFSTLVSITDMLDTQNSTTLVLFLPPKLLCSCDDHGNSRMTNNKRQLIESSLLTIATQLFEVKAPRIVFLIQWEISKKNSELKNSKFKNSFTSFMMDDFC